MEEKKPITTVNILRAALAAATAPIDGSFEQYLDYIERTVSDVTIREMKAAIQVLSLAEDLADGN